MWTKARLSRCYHQFICCHVCNVATGPRDRRSSGSGAAWDTVFCLFHKWSSVMMMQWYWYSHQELSKQKSGETKALHMLFLYLKITNTTKSLFLKFPRFSQKENKLFPSHKNLQAFSIHWQLIYGIHTLSCSRDQNSIKWSDKHALHGSFI